MKGPRSSLRLVAAAAVWDLRGDGAVDRSWDTSTTTPLAAGRLCRVGFSERCSRQAGNMRRSLNTIRNQRILIKRSDAASDAIAITAAAAAGVGEI